MRYLKKYENKKHTKYFNQEDVNLVNEFLQEILDEYNITLINIKDWRENPFPEEPGFYCFTEIHNGDETFFRYYIHIRIIKEKSASVSIINDELWKNLNIMYKKDIIEFGKRVESIGGKFHVGNCNFQEYIKISETVDDLFEGYQFSELLFLNDLLDTYIQFEK